VVLVRTDIAKEHITIIFRVKECESSLFAAIPHDEWGREPLVMASPLSYLSVTVDKQSFRQMW
jgi:hypothetical protein